jgi:hypothetical protein
VAVLGLALLVTFGRLVVALEEARQARAEVEFWQQFYDRLINQGEPVEDHTTKGENMKTTDAGAVMHEERVLVAATLGAHEVPSLRIEHPLEVIFRDAVDQARKGKGDARHGLGREFMKQTWLETANVHGPAFLTGQAEKKLRESLALPYAYARSEMLGAMVYIAMAVIKLDRDNGLGPLRTGE